MGFFKDLFSKETKSKILKGVEQSAKQGVINGLMGVNNSEEIYSIDYTNGSLMNNINTPYNSIDHLEDNNLYKQGFIGLNSKNIESTKSDKAMVIDAKNPSYGKELAFSLPKWSYADFINERTIFQKGLGSIFNDPGWFYFKIFFEFENPYGLLGHCQVNVSDADAKFLNNCAYKYLEFLKESPVNKYQTDHIEDRMIALKRFTNLLQYISSSAPWFFKSIKNLQSINPLDNTKLTNEKTIDIECNPDAIDMRLQSLLDLYKYACYDDVNQIEIIPENLRKFNMSIVVFQSPIKALHTAVKANSTTFNYKTINPDSNGNSNSNITKWDNVMSYKIYHLYNCEIMTDSFQSTIASDMNNEKPFNISPSIKIKFDRLYTHTMNEIFGAMWGSDGFYYGKSINENTTSTKKRLQALSKAITTNNGKALVEASEAITHNIHVNSNLLSNAGIDLLTKTLFYTSLSKDYELGTLYGDVGVGSKYYREKIQNIKNGSLDIKWKGAATELYDLKQKIRTFDINNGKRDLIDTLSNRWGKHIK